MAERGWLVVMARLPQAGAVKSRLARAIGAAEAVRFYRSALDRTLRRLGPDPRWRLLLAVTPEHARWLPPWPPAIPRLGQGRGDLGTRMQRLMDELPPGPVVIIGSDVPAVRPPAIARAFKALGNCDAVFGPSPDGGYWLVGMKRRPHVPNAFAHVRWSSPHALSDTLDNLAGREIGFIDSLPDVDEAEDYGAWLRGAPGYS